jgi:hypothetical protein
MQAQFMEEARRAEEKFMIEVPVSRQEYFDLLLVWRHCRQITNLKPAALRLEKLAVRIREQLDKKGAP